MGYKIRFGRDWSCSHRGAPEVTYGPGVYSVPEDVPAEIAERALRSGRARLEHEPVTIEAPVTPPRAKRGKALRGAPENKQHAT